MTAVEWLIEQFNTFEFMYCDRSRIIEIAKEMERQQLEKAFIDGAFLFRGDDEDNRFNEWFEQFKNKKDMRYKETIWEQEQRLKEEAKKLSEQNKNKPVNKYLLK